MQAVSWEETQMDRQPPAPTRLCGPWRLVLTHLFVVKSGFGKGEDWAPLVFGKAMRRTAFFQTTWQYLMDVSPDCLPMYAMGWCRNVGL